MKKLLIVVAVLVLIVVVAFAVLAKKLDPEALGAAVIDRVNEEGDVELKAQSFHLDVFRGLKLEAAEARTELPSAEVKASLDQLLLEHQLKPLLKGQLVVNRVLLDRPRIELIGKDAEAPPEQPPPKSQPPETTPEGEGKSLTLSVTSLQIKDGSLVARQAGSQEAEIEVSGFDLDLEGLHVDPSAASPAEGLSTAGSLKVGELRFGELLMKGTTGDFSLDAGLVQLRDLGLITDAAEARLKELDLDMSQAPATYRLALDGGVDLNTLLGVTGQSGFGPMELDFSGQGTGAESEALEGQGVLRLNAGKIPTAAMLEQIEMLLGEGFIIGTAYQPCDIGLRLARNRLHIAPFELVGDNLKIAASGWTDLAGPVDLGLTVFAPRGEIKSSVLRKDQLDGLSDARDWVSIPLRVTGTLQQPDVGLDQAALAEALKQEAKKTIEEAVTKELDGLADRLGRRKKR